MSPSPLIARAVRRTGVEITECSSTVVQNLNSGDVGEEKTSQASCQTSSGGCIGTGEVQTAIAGVRIAAVQTKRQ